MDTKQIVKGFETQLQNYKKKNEQTELGRIVFSGDGVVKITGLKHCKYGELLEINGSIRAIALNLEEHEIGAIVLDDEDKVATGGLVSATGDIVTVPVGPELLGRVVDPLGNAIDGLAPIKTSGKRRPIETPAPVIMDRGKVNEPLQTGIICIDSMIPIGKGQRELIIGDRQTGKTSVAIDTILNQKGKGVICVYVAIGQKASSISSLVHLLSENGAMEYTIIVCSTARDSAPIQYIAPYSGCAMAEEFMYQGKDVLIVYDDLSKHAVAYRSMSLLLKRPPGREAYPGDIFYIHSRLLERAAKLSEFHGGGSMTALPIVETQAGAISAYVPTNVISITDGQIFLETELFNAGVRPAVNVGLSVSRVGSSAQIKAMRTVSGKLRLDLSQYRELAIFAQFGTDLDAQTKSMLAQGERTTEMLKQPVSSPMDVEKQVIILYITMKELLKNISVKKLSAFKVGFLEYVDTNFPQICKKIRENGNLDFETSQEIEAATTRFIDFYFDKVK
ncbi:MAG: F0F1 ATP synthase subunit alpha [Firmicutes bacterium]|nr:F0F1 ATP synthase subunit alpha [Bacillota bacterium]